MPERSDRNESEKLNFPFLVCMVTSNTESKITRLKTKQNKTKPERATLTSKDFRTRKIINNKEEH